MKTHVVKAGDLENKWLLIDATGQTLGRLAARIALVLRGKHKATYSPHLDNGDYVVVVNAEKIHISGKFKAAQKTYYRHSGYPGGIKQTTLEKLMSTHPERALEFAVKGMMPRGPLGRACARKLKVYAGENHNHASQQPQPIQL